MQKPKGKISPVTARAEKELRAFAGSFPETREDFPWGESAFKVRERVFLFLHASDEGLSMSTKLPGSNEAARTMPFAKPTGYGLGKSGWITSSFGPKEKPPMHVLKAWIEESYQAVAPKRLAAQRAAAGVPAAKGRTAKGKKK
jgi:predicted DNA-binding protein (MmcQ/YjbR family)